MAIAPQLLLDRFEGFNRLSSGQKLGMMLALAAVISLVVGSWIWYRTPDYKVLFSNLADRDGGAIVTLLQQQNIPYKMAEGGGAILVPSDLVYETRLKLASQGLPRGGSVGFELLETQKLGISQFQEQVNFQRALEGELARTIQSLSSVQSARVHLAIPRPSVFLREQEKPSASVLLSLYPGRALDAAQVAGITHMVSASVPQLSYKNVTVVDQNGNMLSRTDSDQGRMGLEPSQLEYVRQVEQSYIKRIESILTPIAGPNNVHAQVAADIDFSQVEQTAETFKPNPTPADAAIRSEQSSETSGAGAGAVGVPGALSNQPPGAATAPVTAPNVPAAASAGGGPGGHKESTINYEVDKTIRHVKQGAGSVKRLSVAVVVNNRKQTGKDGKVSSKPFSVEEMRQMNNLVREAMGYSQARGDTVNVVNADFNLGDKPAEAPFWKDPDTIDLVKEVVKNLLILGIVLLFVFGVVKPLLTAFTRTSAREEEVQMAAAAEGAAEARGVERIVTAEASYEETLGMVKDLAKQEPAIVANVVKEWVNE